LRADRLPCALNARKTQFYPFSEQILNKFHRHKTLLHAFCQRSFKVINVKSSAIAAVITASLFAGTAHASTVAIENGSFEQPGTFTGTFQTLAAGSDGITGWTVSGAGVDHIRTYWTASDGGYSLDMNAGDAGAISQDVENLAVGDVYEVSFDLAANPDRGPVIKSVLASMGGVSGIFEFDGTGKDRVNMGWETRTFSFQAASATATISFTGTGPGLWGAALDNISITQITGIPVPASLLLFGTALGALGMVRSKSRKGLAPRR
jgi:choice-of-anchor C domain-containing protein